MVASLQADKEHRVPDKLVRDKFTAACNYVHIKNWLASQRERYAKHQALKNQPGTGSAANDDETTNPLHLAWQEAFGGSAASTMGTNPFESGGSSETPAASAEAPAPPGSAATPPGAGDDDGCGIPDLAPLCRCAEDCTLAAGKVSPMKWQYVVPHRSRCVVARSFLFVLKGSQHRGQNKQGLKQHEGFT